MFKVFFECCVQLERTKPQAEEGEKGGGGGKEEVEEDVTQVNQKNPKKKDSVDCWDDFISRRFDGEGGKLIQTVVDQGLRGGGEMDISYCISDPCLCGV